MMVFLPLMKVACMLQLSSIGVANEEQNRQALRELLFTAPDIEEHISGVVSSPFYSGANFVTTQT